MVQEEERDGFDSDQVLLMTTTTSEKDKTSLYLDTKCSNHMTWNRIWLIDLNPSVINNVKFVNNNSIVAEGFGKVMIMHKDGKVAYLNDVLYVPNMKNNLLNLGQL